MKRTALILALALLTGYAGVASAQEYAETYNEAIAAAEAKKYAEAFKKYELAAQQATAAGEKDIAKKSHIMCAKIAKIIGTEAYKAGDYTKALAEFESGLKHEPSYMPNLYMKGMTQKKLGDIDAAMASLMETADGADGKTGRTAAKAIRDHYHAEASQIAAKETMSKAEAAEVRTLLGKMQEYGQEPDANTHYYLGLAAKAEGKYAEGITHADDAIAAHRGSRSDKAKLYFLKGECLMLQGNNADAKVAFAEAAYGSYKASAQHYIETL
jgi:tetratricopeptide (TPR) repeat protein